MQDIAEIILIADPRITEIPIKDNQEQLVDLYYKNEICCDKTSNHLDGRFKVRETVFDKLKQAQMLLPPGLRFCIYEAYRSLALQEKFFLCRFAETKCHYPAWDYIDLFNETVKLVSPVVNLDSSINIPPHSTGGAIDIYLIDNNGNPVDMGLHPKDAIEDKDGSFAATYSKIISNDASRYRKVMCDSLSSVGFVNYPTEYWHWGYGDRYWAYHTGAAHAIYGSC